MFPGVISTCGRVDRRALQTNQTLDESSLDKHFGASPRDTFTTPL
jgi:hypothetical protein